MPYLPAAVLQREEIANPAAYAWPLGQLPGDIQIGKGVTSIENSFPEGYHLLGKTPENLVERTAQMRLYRHIVYFRGALVQCFIT